MTVQFEVKGSLARLLATEDIIVEHKKVSTACFNVHTRCLTLPMWEKATDSIYTMLVLHEISHALWTPNEDWTKDYKVPHQFFNIVEDVRVEKLCKRKYPGSPKSFYAGYKELHEQDFFCIGDEDISKMNLADRINLYYKIGSFVNINFTPEEKEIVDIVFNAETFEDALSAAEILYNYCKKEIKGEKIDINIDLRVSSSGGGAYSGEIEDDESHSEEVEDLSKPSDFGENSFDETSGSLGGESSGSFESDKEENKEETKKEDSQIEDSTDEDPEVKTVDSLEESIRELINDTGSENSYIEVPELDLNYIIIPNSEIHSVCDNYWNTYVTNSPYNASEVFSAVDAKYKEFKSSAQKEVNYLVKEFECRKAADSYARASTSRTGVLDCTKLHTYKYNEDLFKKITTLADGKNHGLIFILDWSGSMTNVLLDTIKQLYNLIWFCRKVSIPFEVYAFTNSYPLVKCDENGKSNLRMRSYRKREGIFYIPEHFSLMNLFTSKVNSSTLDSQMKSIYRIASRYDRSVYTYYSSPCGMDLSGTPLNESLIALHQILPKFQKENKLQKVQCVILTDGEGAGLTYHREFNRKWETEPYLGTSHIDNNCFLRDRKTGNTYALNNGGWTGVTDVLLKNLRDKFVNTNFIGIRILEPGSSGNFIRNYYKETHNDYGKIMNSWKKEKSFSIKTSGYHTYFGLSSSALSQDSEFSINEDATKVQIKNAFLKSFKKKKMNKKILNEFIDLIA